MMGHLNSFSGRGEFEQKFSKNSKARGVARGGCLSFDLTDTLPLRLSSCSNFVRSREWIMVLTETKIFMKKSSRRIRC